MQKDVIYIDVDDDVTAIIGKIKKSKHKVVALVPPKRAGSLQSAVNLRLLDRMAKADKKSLVLVTHNQALVALAANAKIPVAKNLQSKPELAEISAIIVDDEDDIIDGADLPVGDHAKTVEVNDGTKQSSDTRTDAIDTIDIDDESVSTSAAAASKKTPKNGNKVKIPNFDKFRKRLFLWIGGGVILAALLFWMFGIAPAATIIITAQTSPAPVSSSVNLSTTAATDYPSGTLKVVMQQEKKDEVLEFDATGQKDLGTAATGVVRFSTNSISSLGTIPAGTRLTSSSGLVFTTDAPVTLTTSNYTGTNVGVTAVDKGANYNGATGSMSGAPSGVSAVLTGPTSGGTSNITKVVSADDIERAKGQLIGQSTDEQEQALIAKFTNDEKIIEGSFTVERADAVSAPAVNEPAGENGKAKLTIPTTYTIYAVQKSELDAYLKASLTSQLDDKQQIYDTGIDEATVSNFKKDGETMTGSVTATGEIGPKVDEAAVKEQAKGKRYGEVQSELEAIEGVSEVDIQFSYPWVNKVPNNTDKIQVEFKVE